jgi:hypothetical protein
MTNYMSHSHETVHYESTLDVSSAAYAGVRYRIRKPSFLSRSRLIDQVRELGRSLNFVEAGEGAADRIEAVHLHMKIDRLYLEWGLEAIEGMEIDGERITVESLIAKGPEDLTSEILVKIKAQCTLSESERKN